MNSNCDKLLWQKKVFTVRTYAQFSGVIQRWLKGFCVRVPYPDDEHISVEALYICLFFGLKYLQQTREGKKEITK